MYEAYWQLTHKPFDSLFSPQLYYPGEGHQAALLKLRYAIENRCGAALLIGAGGTGKSLLVQLLKASLPEPIAPFVHVVFPQMPAGELLSYIAEEFGIPGSEGAGRPIKDSVRYLQAAFAENARNGRHAVLAIDEAHLLLDTNALEALRLLLNFETDSQPGVTILLVGQPHLWSAIERMPQLEERLAVKCVLRPMSAPETAAYVQHRLTAAGGRQPLFDAHAVETLHERSRGIPRRVNRLCDLSLLVGYAEEQSVIGHDQVEAVHHELALAAD